MKLSYLNPIKAKQTSSDRKRDKGRLKQIENIHKGMKRLLLNARKAQDIIIN